VPNFHPGFIFPNASFGFLLVINSSYSDLMVLAEFAKISSVCCCQPPGIL